MTLTVPTVQIGGLPAAVMGSMTQHCLIPGCAPGGPGTVAVGSGSVLMGGRPAARVGDLVNFTSCVGPIPMPTGKILPPGAPTVMIG